MSIAQFLKDAAATGVLKAIKSRPAVLWTAGAPVRIYGASGAVAQTVASVTIPAGTIKAGSILELSAMFQFPTPALADCPVEVDIGGVSIWSASPNTTITTMSAKAIGVVSSDQQSLYLDTQLLGGYTAPADAGSAPQGAPFAARAVGFATIAIDFTVDQTFAVKIRPRNDDIAELTGGSLVTYAVADNPVNSAPSNATAIWGHSLVAGTGASATVEIDNRSGTSTNASKTVTFASTSRFAVGHVFSGTGIPADTIITGIVTNTSVSLSNAATVSATNTFKVVGGPMPHQLMVADPARPVANIGIGGETSTQIKTRFLRDKIRGKKWTAVIWASRNDDWTTPAGRAATMANIAAMVANLDAGVKYVVCTEITAQSEGTGQANNTAIQALNALIIAAYPNNYVDLYATLCTDGGRPPLKYAQCVNTTGTWTNGGTAITVASATGITNGMYAIDPGNDGIPDRTTGTISGTTFTLGAATTAAGTTTMVSFIDPGQVHLNDLGYSKAEAAILTKLQALGA